MRGGVGWEQVRFPVLTVLTPVVLERVGLIRCHSVCAPEKVHRSLGVRNSLAAGAEPSKLGSKAEVVLELCGLGFACNSAGCVSFLDRFCHGFTFTQCA